MLVSIIIPIYNVSAYIEKCLISALDQTYKNVEIILVDDCTPDNSMEVVEKVLLNHPRSECVRIIHHQKNKGLSGARNTGIDVAKGEYIYFLDSDDWISLDCIELQVESAIKYNSDMVIGDVESVGDARAFKSWWDFSELSSNYNTNQIIRELYFGHNLYGMACNKLVRRSFVIDNNLYFKEGILHEDDLWSFNSILYLRSISIVNKPTYYYLQREGSIMTTKSDKSDASLFIILYEFIRLIEGEMDRETRYFVSKFIYSQIGRRLFSSQYISLLNTDIPNIKGHFSFSEIVKDPFSKRSIVMLPLFLPSPILKTYYRIIGKLQQYKIIKL